ncbi:MAG: hypothetical protein UV98_C0023G0014 [Parcubacteria group bacterium GW2011_GWB1_43_6]|nr:MAG: hypothetical protein UV98_C0023G0014 [Parcubacteria group bacterium GW2011_GWB1_43_6]
MRKSIIFGFGASLILLFLYFSVLSLISGWDFAVSQFSENWYWVIGLAAGFGIQIGIFTYLRALHRAKVSGKIVAASGTTSTIAMISCCAHYLVNILPVIGISGLAVFLGQYQTELFIVGAISNLAGIFYLLSKAKKFKQNHTL